MNDQLANIIFYTVTALMFVAVTGIYLLKKKRETAITELKISQAIGDGLHEPVSLHPWVDFDRCIGVGACIKACPEKVILGMRNGRVAIVNASLCIGHGACFMACPTEAISLKIGTERRGVDIPHIDSNFETNIRGLFIAGELGGMGLIRNAAEQGRQAVENIRKSLDREHRAEYDLIIAGAGPAGISASLAAKKNNLRFILLEQDTLGGAVATYPRNKIVMTSPVELPLAGKIKLTETSKKVLIDLWTDIVKKYSIPLIENCRVDSVSRNEDIFSVVTSQGKTYNAAKVLLATGRRGTPRKLNVPGEDTEKVAYRLLEPEEFSGKKILVVGGGDSAIESALLLSGSNNVTLSYRNDVFSRLKPLNKKSVDKAIETGKLKALLSSQVKSIETDHVVLSVKDGELKLENDMVFIFAGGELPSQFLEKCGVNVRTAKGEIILKH